MDELTDLLTELENITAQFDTALQGNITDTGSAARQIKDAITSIEHAIAQLT